MKKSPKMKINWIQNFNITGNRAGFYATCELFNMETSQKATVVLGAPVSAGYTNYFDVENLNQELRKVADTALYEFLSSEHFASGVYYFEWMENNTFKLIEEKPKWAI